MRYSNGEFGGGEVHKNTRHGPQEKRNECNHVKLGGSEGRVSVRILDAKQVNTG